MTLSQHHLLPLAAAVVTAPDEAAKLAARSPLSSGVAALTGKQRRETAHGVIEHLEKLRAYVRDNHDDLTGKQQAAFTVEADALNVLLQASLTHGASPCPSCGTPALGLAHESATGKGQKHRYLYEVGCPNPACVDHRATELLPELAVERWNAGEYDAPKPKSEAPADE